MDICKARDEDGVEIIPNPVFRSGTVRCDTLTLLIPHSAILRSHSNLVMQHHFLATFIPDRLNTRP